MVMVVALAVSISGCGEKPDALSATQPTELVSANQVNAKDARLVIYQVAGYGHLPMSPLQPLRGVPREITNQSDVQSIVDALNHPDGKAFTRMARNNRLAVVGQNGQVVMYGIGSYTNQGCDITAQDSSSKLMPALRVATTRARIARPTLASPAKSLSYHDTGGPTRSAYGNNQALQELLAHYSPLVLKGNRRCEASEIQTHARHTPRFLTVKLARSEAFDAIVMAKDSEWPPKLYDTSARLERVTFDTITIFSEGSGLARFVFADARSGQCLFTDPVNSFRLLKQAQGRNPAVYGPDLFEEVVSTLANP